MGVLVPLELSGSDEGAVGWVNAAWGLGASSPGAALALLLERANLAAGLLLAACCSARRSSLPAVWAEAPVAYIALLGVGVGYTLAEVAGETLLQRLGSDETLGACPRVAGDRPLRS